MNRYYFCMIAFVVCGWLFVLDANSQPAPQRLRLGFSIGIDKITPEILTRAKADGIDCIETSLPGYIDSARKLRFTNEEIIRNLQAAKKAADDAGIKIWSIHMPYSMQMDISLGDDAERQKVLDLHKKIIGYCSILKPKIILFHPSSFLGLNERELRKSQMIKSAIELNKTIKAISATMVIENMFGPELLRDSNRERPLLRTVEESVEIMNRLPADIYAAIDLNHTKYPSSMIYAMGARLKTLHVADGTDQAENHFFPCSGEGHNDWTAILIALNAVEYKGPFMYESKYNEINDFKSCYESLYQSFVHAIKVGK